MIWVFQISRNRFSLQPSLCIHWNTARRPRSYDIFKHSPNGRKDKFTFQEVGVYEIITDVYHKPMLYASDRMYNNQKARTKPRSHDIKNQHTSNPENKHLSQMSSFQRMGFLLNHPPLYIQNPTDKKVCCCPKSPPAIPKTQPWERPKNNTKYHTLWKPSPSKRLACLRASYRTGWRGS
jgi:hypothetical protein